MIVGRVVNGVDPTIEITVHGEGERSLQVDAIIDTGFTGQLTLPPDCILDLGLASRGARHAILADGRTVLSRVFVAEVDWNGETRRIQVIEAPGVPLVGMRLLKGFRLEIHVEDAGLVAIERLDSTPQPI